MSSRAKKSAGVGRRDVLKLAAASGIGLLGAPIVRVWAEKSFGEYPFTLGIASGDPWPDGFVLWTRLAPKPFEFSGGMPMKVVPVEWEVAEDERFSRIVRSGSEPARPELAHSVHVEVTGLKPSRPYWYRFKAGGEVSSTGTVRTAPANGANTELIRLGVAGCQNYEQGLFTAYRHLSQVADLDAVFHYGDYIYEVKGRDCSPPVDNCVRPHLGEEIYSLDDYRRRYAQYKLDADLQAAHAAVAFLSSYDDHEVDNNWSRDRTQDNAPAEAFLLRRAAAMQAWYEHMPVRRAQFPANGVITMYRRLDFGDLVRIHVLDTRQYRGGRDEYMEFHGGGTVYEPVTMLGTQQEAWLEQGMNSSARWNLLAQQVMVMPFNYPAIRKEGPVNRDSWSGYVEARQRLVRTIQQHGQKNVIISTGDVHQHHAGLLPVREGDIDGPAAAVEFVCTSISSGGDGAPLQKGWDNTLAENPNCPLVNAQRGFQTFEIGRSEWRTNVWTLDKVSTPGGRLSKLASVVVERGQAKLQLDS